MFVRTAILAALAAATSTAEAAVLVVDCVSGPYLTIQSAVWAAASGDTVLVRPCVPHYNENVSVAGADDIHLVAAEAGTPDHGGYPTGIGAVTAPGVIIDGTSLPAACVSIAGSQSVSISGFRLQNCAFGVNIQQSFDTVVHGNRIQNHASAGILDAFTGGTVITGNLVGFNDYGILLQNTRETRVLDNWVANNVKDGIAVDGDRCMVTNNRVQGSGVNGVHLVDGVAARVERNDAFTSVGTNLRIEAPVVVADAVGNDTVGSLVDLAGSDLAENL